MIMAAKNNDFIDDDFEIFIFNGVMEKIFERGLKIEEVSQELWNEMVDEVREDEEEFLEFITNGVVEKIFEHGLENEEVSQELWNKFADEVADEI